VLGNTNSSLSPYLALVLFILLATVFFNNYKFFIILAKHNKIS
jgi:hypothetical protein